MRLPLSKRGLVTAGALAGAVVYWRVRQQRRESEMDWADDIAAAAGEGIAAARAALDGDDDDV